MQYVAQAVNKLATSPTSRGEMLPTSRLVSCRVVSCRCNGNWALIVYVCTVRLSTDKLVSRRKCVTSLTCIMM